MEKRKPIIKKTLTAAAVLFAYYIFVRLTGLSIPCYFHVFTGLKCPSCGITHMLMLMAKLQFAQAFSCNRLLFFMLPFLICLLAVKIVFMPHWLEQKSRIFRIIIMSCCVILVLYGIFRNILPI